MTKLERKMLGIAVPVETAETIEQLAASKGISVTALVNLMISDWLAATNQNPLQMQAFAYLERERK